MSGTVFGSYAYKIAYLVLAQVHESGDGELGNISWKHFKLGNTLIDLANLEKSLLFQKYYN